MPSRYWELSCIYVFVLLSTCACPPSVGMVYLCLKAEFSFFSVSWLSVTVLFLEAFTKAIVQCGWWQHHTFVVTPGFAFVTWLLEADGLSEGALYGRFSHRDKRTKPTSKHFGCFALGIKQKTCRLEAEAGDSISIRVFPQSGPEIWKAKLPVLPRFLFGCPERPRN